MCVTIVCMECYRANKVGRQTLPCAFTFVQAKENHITVETCASLEKNQSVVEKLVKIKYLFLIEKLKNQIQRISQNSEIRSIDLVTAPYCAVRIQGTKLAVENAKFKILIFIKRNITCSTFQVANLYNRPTLKSPEMLRLCKKLQSELAVSLKIQIQPKVLSSALDESGALVQICEGDIALDNSDAFINFTDTSFTLSDDVQNMLDQKQTRRYDHLVKCNTLQPFGTVVCFGRSVNKKTIHAILPQWINGARGEGDLITEVVIDGLSLAARHNAVSVSLPFLSCSNDYLPPLDVFAESCLSGVQQFLRRSHRIKIIRLVLPVTMANIFQDKFTSGIFQKFSMADDIGIADTRRFCTLGRLGDPAWLWEDDDGQYNYYSPENNKLLNQKTEISPYCNLKIGPIKYTVNYSDMTQTNTSTLRERRVACIPLGSIWQFRNDKGNWEQLSPQVTLMVEAMYLTGSDHTLMINDQLYSYNFKHMTQFNVDKQEKTTLRRIDSVFALDDTCNGTRSRVMISGIADDVNTAAKGLRQCMQSLITHQVVELQQKFFPALIRHMKQIQTTNDVVITMKATKPTSSNVTVRVTGNIECVQKSIIEIYQATTMEDLQTPMEWEPQTKSVELIGILRGSPEWNKIWSRMKTLNCKIISIERIQNKFLWEKYVQHKELMSRKGIRSMLETELFHGTRATPPNWIYESEEGFDMRYSRAGMWGVGNYFAENANYASCFAYKTTDKVLQLFLVKVLVGDTCCVPKDKTLRMPPFKADGKVRYDTVNGFINGLQIYITYSNDKAYPFYLISYTV